MKTTILISLLCFATMGVYAQYDTKDQAPYKEAVCKQYPGMPASATPTWPSGEYISLVAPECAPCYTYTTKHGLKVMECPGLWFLPEDQKVVRTAGNLDVSSAHSYSGNYPKVCKRDANMPAGAVPAWPKSEYTPTQDPHCAPCYTYTTKHGLDVMECPFLWFPPEK